MSKVKAELGPLAVSRIKDIGIHFVGGVTGLALNVNNTGSRSWILRFQISGRRRDMGLGGFPDVTLATAKEQARLARELIRQGIDPIEHAKSQRLILEQQRLTAITFNQAAVQYIESQKDHWRSQKHQKQWHSTLITYANPVIGSLLISDIQLSHILQILEPIWKSKTETASRLRGRIEVIIDWAIARGLRTAPNPARWKSLLDKILPQPSKVSRVVHHRAIPYQALPSFYFNLQFQAGMGARALELLILTATRSGEVRGALWDEFDLENRIWTIPASRMKAGKEHRVPLCDRAIAILHYQLTHRFCDYVFPSHKNGQLSDMTLAAVLRRMKVDAVPHGFRSTFRDWCAEETDFPHEVAEMALAHTIANKVEAAYRRGDLFDKRISLMNSWQAFILNRR